MGTRKASLMMAPPRAPAARNLRLETCRVAALLLLLLLLLLLAAPAAAAPLRSAAERPHVVFLFCDNVGWSNVGYHRARPTREVATPQIDGLVRTGVELDRMYTYKFCSPSRSSLLSGRLPVHVNIYNDDPARPGAGVPTGMTMISEKLATAGYRGHFIGKWHGASRSSVLLLCNAMAAPCHSVAPAPDRHELKP